MDLPLSTPISQRSPKVQRVVSTSKHVLVGKWWVFFFRSLALDYFVCVQGDECVCDGVQLLLLVVPQFVVMSTLGSAAAGVGLGGAPLITPAPAPQRLRNSWLQTWLEHTCACAKLSHGLSLTGAIQRGFSLLKSGNFITGQMNEVSGDASFTTSSGRASRPPRGAIRPSLRRKHGPPSQTSCRGGRGGDAPSPRVRMGGDALQPLPRPAEPKLVPG